MKLRALEAGRFALEGTVSNIDAESIRSEVDEILLREAAEPGELNVFDLTDVTDGNSLVIALMMGWLRESERQDKKIRYSGVPGRLAELIEFYGLDAVLPIIQSESGSQNTSRSAS